MRDEYESGIFVTIGGQPHNILADEDLLLIDAMLTGSASAWREFQSRYDWLVHRCIMKVTRRFTSIVSADDVRDIASSLYLSLLQNDMHKLRSFDPARGNRFSSWIGMLAINCAYDYLRALKREPSKEPLSDAGELVCHLPDPFQATVEREHALMAQAVLADFSQKDQQFADLYFVERMDPQQIADRMNISVKTVYSKKHKIQSRLESALDQHAA